MSKTIKIDNKQLKKYLEEKGNLIVIGRGTSEKIEDIEKEMEEIDNKVKEEEKKVDISDILEQEKEVTEIVQGCINKMNELKKQIYARMKEQVDGTLHKKYDELKNRKEKLEEERNKIAIKAQKYNDRIIPLGRKLILPFLDDEFDDFETLRIEDGQVVATIFNHVEDYKTNFRKKK